jgi:hypothetical protein
MVRRGSTVRVRQRALQNPRSVAPSFGNVFAGRPIRYLVEQLVEQRGFVEDPCA